MSIKKIVIMFFLITIVNSVFFSSFAENIIRRWNLIIDLDTGKITIANDNAEYQSLLSDGSDATTSITTGSTNSWNVAEPQKTTTTATQTWDLNLQDIATVQQTTTTKSTPTSLITQAIQWWYTNKLTIFNNENDFKPKDLITREQAAKFFAQGALSLWYQWDSANTCSFKDKDTGNKDLVESIEKICKLWLMQWDGIAFRPLDYLTYAESMTIASKIAWYKYLEQKSGEAWRMQYYNFIATLGVLPENISTKDMESSISRWDALLLLYNISKKDISWQQTQSYSPVSIGAWISDDPTFTTALLWMNSSNMTKFRQAATYNPLISLTREQGAHFLSIYDQKFDQNDTQWWECALQDIGNSQFSSAINYVCKKWILNGGNNLFRPWDTMTKAEFMAGLLNMKNKSYSNSGWSRQTNVYKTALSLEIITRADEATFLKPITRYEVAMILHKSYLQDKFKESLSDTNANYTVISPIEIDNVPINSNQEKVSIDINSIDNKDFTNGFVTLFGRNYKLTKRQVTQYFPTSYVWHGELIDITEDKVIWSISMSIGQQWIRKSLIDWYIIIEDLWWYYNIKNTEQFWNYIITKQL